jgi:hypothetical protein
MTVRIILSLLLLPLLPLSAQEASNSHRNLVERVKSAQPLRVLFVGNSYSFKIPKAFEKLATGEGKKIEVEQVTKGGWTLAKHAKAEATLEKIAKGKWDIVVLQEQSQTPAIPEAQRCQAMDPAAKSLATAIRKAGAIPIIFQTWGRRDGDQQNAKTYPNDTFESMQKRLTDGYRKAAEAAGNAHIVPVGEVWAKVHAAGGDHKLFAKDGSHPAAAGNQLGATVFYAAFFDELPKATAFKQASAAKFSNP